MVRILPTTAEADDAAADAEDGASKPPVDPFAAIAEEPFTTLEYAKRRVLLATCLDSDATCDDTPKEGTMAHSTPLECLKESDPELLDVLRTSSVLYQDTVRQLLTSLRVFSFTLEHTSS